MNIGYIVLAATLDVGPGCEFETVQSAADVAMPGDEVVIAGGIYRERVDPRNGGTAERPIVYRAAAGERVEITGADVIKGWTALGGGKWTVSLDYSLFGDGFNPFTDNLSGNWFDAKGLVHPRTALIFNGRRLSAAEREFSAGEGKGTIVATFPSDPNGGTVELVVREAAFYPSAEGRDYITLKGIVFRDAAPNWAPPTREQVGIVGTHWSRGWTIEDCEIYGSSATGLTLGKYGDGFNDFSDNSQDFTATVERAAAHGLDRVGFHTIRRCRIHHCSQAGICGSLGAVFSTVEDCDIGFCCWHEKFGGFEMAGIKIHGAVGFTIAGNTIHHCGGWFGGIWLDWMAQDAVVRENLMYANENDLYFEVCHGPILVAGNRLMSHKDINLAGTSNVRFVGNVITDAIYTRGDERRTPLFKPGTCEIDILEKQCEDRNNRFEDNIFYFREKHD